MTDQKRKEVFGEISRGYKRPFRYDPLGQYIFDANGNMVLSVRNWGYLESKFGEKNAEVIQDLFGTMVSDVLNKNLEIDEKKQPNNK